MVGWRDSKTILYISCVGCIESQNTYLDASGHMFDLGLHRNVVSNKPVPQHPSWTSLNPENTHTHMIRKMILYRTKKLDYLDKRKWTYHIYDLQLRHIRVNKYQNRWFDHLGAHCWIAWCLVLIGAWNCKSCPLMRSNQYNHDPKLRLQRKEWWQLASNPLEAIQQLQFCELLHPTTPNRITNYKRKKFVIFLIRFLFYDFSY